MQKSLLLLGVAAGLLLAPATATAKGHTPSKARQALTAANRKAASMSAETVARFYHPETVVYEDYDREEGQWVHPSTVKFTYNKAGQVLSETSGDGMLKYTYNEAGMLVKIESYGIIDNDYKLSYVYEYTYDTVVKDLVVKEVSTSYDVITGESYGSSEYGAEITRNADGNIAKIQDYSVWDGQKYYDDALVIEYGADKKAVKITEVDNDGEVLTTLTDIVWATTDGQITTFEYDDYNGDMYFSNNRIASATIDEGDRYPEPCKFTATYDGDSYHSKMTTKDQVALEIDFKCLEKFAGGEDFDECYSFECTSLEASFEFDEDTNTYFWEYTDKEIQENHVNPFGIVLYNKRIESCEYANPEYNDGEESVEEEKAEVTYDDNFGYPLSAIFYSTSYETGELVRRSRVTYSDYVNVDPSGVASAVVDSAAEAEYYNLQGMRVQGALTPGLYIVRQGNTTSKVLVK